MSVNECLLAAFGDSCSSVRARKTYVRDDDSELADTCTAVVGGFLFVFGRRSAEIYDTPYSFSLGQKVVGRLIVCSSFIEMLS